MTKIDITCFKAYDIRGRVPDQLNDDVAYRIGRAFVQFLSAKRVVVGHDIRLTSPGLTSALVDGITDGGADVVHIGQCGTEEVYFATFELNADGGICVTASHNPMDYNGLKLVREGSRPISSDTGLNDVQKIAETGDFAEVSNKGTVEHRDMRPVYVDHLLSYIDVSSLKPLKVVVNAGNGGAGAVIDGIEPHLPLQFIKVHHQPDGSFPNGIPNPLLQENQASTSNAAKEHGADLGVAWDGDFDRCFFFDENGDFIDGYYVVGLLAEAFLTKYPGSKIVHDPRLTWNTIDIAEKFDGTAVQSKTGHAFIKERMRKEDAVYGGEMSAHHYFKDFAYCDNGNVPWLLVTELMSKRGAKLSSLIEQRKAAYPCSGEINRTVDADPKELIAAIEERYAGDVKDIDKTDGLSMSFDNWRFSVRMSSTEPLLRVNVESRGDEELMRSKTDELISFIDSYGN